MFTMIALLKGKEKLQKKNHFDRVNFRHDCPKRDSGDKYEYFRPCCPCLWFCFNSADFRVANGPWKVARQSESENKAL